MQYFNCRLLQILVKDFPSAFNRSIKEKYYTLGMWHYLLLKKYKN